MMGSNACYSCRKPGDMMQDCPNRKVQEKGKEKVQPNCPSEEAPRRQQIFALKSRVQGKALMVMSRVCRLNQSFMCLTVYSFMH